MLLFLDSTNPLEKNHKNISMKVDPRYLCRGQCSGDFFSIQLWKQKRKEEWPMTKSFQNPQAYFGKEKFIPILPTFLISNLTLPTFVLTS